MKHYGDITKISGDKVEPVDCIIGGSPCQDLSVAGKRKGLKGERSGLFMEQVRVTKEMQRKHEERIAGTDIYRLRAGRWLVWENVPGAMSSGTPKGEDFRIVLEEICRIVDENAVIPEPPRGGGGSTADASWETDGTESIQSLGEYGTLNFSEQPTVVHNDVVGSHLWQILEDSQHRASYLRRFWLSQKACQGILNRAQKRGKKLPEILRIALERQAYPSKNEQDVRGG